MAQRMPYSSGLSYCSSGQVDGKLTYCQRLLPGPATRSIGFDLLHALLDALLYNPLCEHCTLCGAGMQQRLLYSKLMQGSSGLDGALLRDWSRNHATLWNVSAGASHGAPGGKDWL